MSRTSKSFGAFSPVKPHLLTGSGGLAAEVADVRADVEAAFQVMEARAGLPELDFLDISGGALLEDGGDIVLKGRNMLGGGTRESMLTFGTGTSQLDLSVLKPGDTGLSVQIVQGTVLGAAFAKKLTGTSVTMTNGSKDVTGVLTHFKTDLQVGDKIKLDADSVWGTIADIVDDTHLTLVAVYGGTGGTGAASKQTPSLLVITLAVGSTSNGVATLLNDPASPVYRVIFAAGHGTGVMVVAAATPFVGGTGDPTGYQVLVSGVEAFPKMAAPTWADGTVTVTVPDLTLLTPARAAGDYVNITLQANGQISAPLTGLLTT